MMMPIIPISVPLIIIILQKTVR